MQDSTHIQVTWKTHAIGAVWIAAACALAIGSCTAGSLDAEMSLGELAIPALISLVVGAFVPGTQDYLPWGRWWKRWREREVQRGIEELEREVDDEASQVRIEGAPYRGAIVHATKPRKRRSDRRFIVALVVGSILTMLFTLGVAGFLNRHDLAKTMAASGILATMVLAFASSRDQGRLEAKERLRIEAGVREMEDKHVRVAEEQAVEMEHELEDRLRHESRQ